MILINGCSFTEGYDLEDINDNWPTQFSKLTNQDIINLALGGASNERIFRTTIEWLVNNNVPEHVIIGWTGHNRNELSHELGMYVRLLTTSIEQENGPKTDDLSVIHKTWMNHLLNEWINYRNWIYRLLFLQDYFESKKIKYTFFSAFTDPLMIDFINATPAALELADLGRHNRKKISIEPSASAPEFLELQTLCNQINFNHWILPTSSMSAYVTDQGFQKDDNGHFYADGYAEWAKYLVDNIELI